VPISTPTRELLAELLNLMGTYDQIRDAFQQTELTPPPIPENLTVVRTRRQRQLIQDYLKSFDWSDQDQVDGLLRVCREGLKEYTRIDRPLAPDLDLNRLVRNDNLLRAKGVLERDGYTIDDDTLSIVPQEHARSLTSRRELPLSVAAFSPSGPGSRHAFEDAVAHAEEIALDVLAGLGVQEAPPQELSGGDTVRWLIRRAARELLAHPSYRATVDDATAEAFGHLTAAAVTATETLNDRRPTRPAVESAPATSMNHHIVTAWSLTATDALAITTDTSASHAPQ